MALDFEFAAATVYMEARGGGAPLMDAVANVICNRLKAGRFGKTLAAVCLAPKQFSCWQSQVNLAQLSVEPESSRIWTEAKSAVRFAQAGALDATLGATHYFDDSIEAPSWTKAPAELTVRIGNVSFYRNVP